jgi:two-component system, LytTR family, sensor histidine kinase AlgZ
MHPIFSKWTRLAGYMLGSQAAGGLVAALLHMTGAIAWREAFEMAAPMCLMYAFVCLTPWYSCRALPLGSTAPWRLSGEHLGAAVLATALWVGLARLLGRSLALGNRIDSAMPLLITVGLLLYLLAVALHYTLLAIQASRDAAVQARDAELRALKAQINPHFLFNSLNSIAALATSDPPKAREMCLHLSDFLRKTLGLGEKQSIAWREELQLARTYLDVEQIRFGERLRVETRMDAACADCQVPPLVLQPLIENAVRHGIATLVEGGEIRLGSDLRDGYLRVRVENPFDVESPAPRRNGLGLRNVGDRLATRFAGTARLTTKSDHNTFVAEMMIPCQKQGQA